MIKLLILLSISISINLYSLKSFSQQNDFEISKNIDVFVTLYKQLNNYYVDDINPGQLVKTAIDAMLESLDPYTVYIPESEIEDYKFMTTGQYGGIGAGIYKRGRYIYISDPYEGYPADKAGLKAGDKIIEINGKEVIDKTVDEVSTALKGQSGTSVTIKIQGDTSQKAVEKEIIREEITVDNVPYYGMVAPDIAYINLNEFRQNAARDVKDAFQKLNEAKSLKGVILDLRGNGGGLLNEAVNIVNIFVDKGQMVVSTRGKIKDKNNVHKTLGSATDTKIPLVVLVNENSASASEIVAGAIQDIDRGVIIGQRTFGKGLVQNIVPLSYNSELKITIAKYYIPSGRCVQALDYSHKDEAGNAGVVPDSLLKAFKTKNGRIVYEGRGIDPDILIKPEYFSEISAALINKHLLFDYATLFYRKTPSIPMPSQFAITDEIYKDFVAFLQGKDYSYTTESETALEVFRKQAENEKYFDEIKPEFDKLHDKIFETKNHDVFKFRDEISELLKLYIIPRYYYNKGRIEASLKNDPVVGKAVEILSDPAAYHSMLSVQNKK
jgi:carboxyl-terminal processing protease